jgi:hypothetical protein
MTDETDQPPENPFARGEHDLNHDLMQFMMSAGGSLDETLAEPYELLRHCGTIGA